MPEYNWGQDPELPEDSSTLNEKLFALFFFAGSGGMPFAIHYWMMGGDSFSPVMCILAAVFGAVMLAVYSRQNRLPVWAGLLAGSVAGVGTYGATAMYAFDRQKLFVLELAIPLFVGALPGIIIYVIVVRLYYKATEP